MNEIDCAVYSQRNHWQKKRINGSHLVYVNNAILLFNFNKQHSKLVVVVMVVQIYRSQSVYINIFVCVRFLLNQLNFISIYVCVIAISCFSFFLVKYFHGKFLIKYSYFTFSFFISSFNSIRLFAYRITKKRN